MRLLAELNLECSFDVSFFGDEGKKGDNTLTDPQGSSSLESKRDPEACGCSAREALRPEPHNTEEGV
jgi:hypothetical protein